MNLLRSRSLKATDASFFLPVEKERFAYLDGVRAIACISIFLLHFSHVFKIDDRANWMSFRRFLEYGFGVSIFILVSGAFIERDLRLVWARPSCYFRYLLRKFARLSVPYFLVLSAMLCALFIIRAEVDLLDVISHFLYIHNLSDEYLYSFSPPFWYLSVQMQAYVLLPLLGWFCSVEQFGGSVRRVFLLALAFAISLGFVITLTKLGSQDGAFSRWVLLNPMSVTHSIFVHLPNFLVGMAIQSALMHEKSPSIRRGLSIDLVIVFVIGVLVFISLISEGSSYSSSYVRYGFPAIVFPLAFGLVLIPRSLLVKRFFDHPILQWIGKISFAFYLVHYSCIKVCILILHRIDLGMIGIPEHVVMLPFCFLLSILSAYILNRVVHLTWFCRKISG